MARSSAPEAKLRRHHGDEPSAAWLSAPRYLNGKRFVEFRTWPRLSSRQGLLAVAQRQCVRVARSEGLEPVVPTPGLQRCAPNIERLDLAYSDGFEHVLPIPIVLRWAPYG